MRRLLILFCLAAAASLAIFSMAAVPPRQIRNSESKVAPAPVAPSSGVAVTVQVSPTAPLPYRFYLEQNYPNPYNEATVIRYSCATDAYVTLKVYNILGQEVVTLVAERKSGGSHTVLWDSRDKNGTTLASGIYLYRMITGPLVFTKKLILLR